jgi:hypothetical protein
MESFIEKDGKGYLNMLVPDGIKTIKNLKSHIPGLHAERFIHVGWGSHDHAYATSPKYIGS